MVIIMDDNRILEIWHQVTSGKPESKRNVWVYLLGRDDGSAAELRQRFEFLRKSGLLIPKGSYRFGDCKYIVANPLRQNTDLISCAPAETESSVSSPG